MGADGFVSGAAGGVRGDSSGDVPDDAGERAPAAAPDGTSPSAPPARYVVSVAGKEHMVVVDAGRVAVDGREFEASLAVVGATPGAGATAWGGSHPGSSAVGVSLLLDGAARGLLARAVSPGAWELESEGRAFRAEVLDERAARVRRLSGPAGGAAATPVLKAPMPGLVVRVGVEEGQPVEAGAPVVIVEAMKMENELRAPAAAKVARVRVAAGDAVEKGQVLVEFAPPEAS